eukprot:1730199-Ditylum_brightwellii.AAC.1
MVQLVLKTNGRVVPCQTCRILHEDERNNPALKQKIDIFDDLIEKRWELSENPATDPDERDFVPYQDEEEEPREMNDIEELYNANKNHLDQ